MTEGFKKLLKLAENGSEEAREKLLKVLLDEKKRRNSREWY